MGCRLEFRKTAADTNGELLEFDCFVAPGRVIARPHLHPVQTERFTVLAGRVHGRVAGRDRAADTGDVVDVPPGTPHVWQADDGTEVHLRVEFRPALQSERFLETVFGLARDRLCTANGTPRLLQAAVLLAGHPDEMWPAGMPMALLRLFVVACAPIGRLLGYRAYYPRYINVSAASPAGVGGSTHTSSPS